MPKAFGIDTPRAKWHKKDPAEGNGGGAPR